MKKRIENDVKDAFDGLCPDVFDQILSGCEKKKGSMVMTENTNRTTGRRALRAVLIAAAAVILVAALALGGVFLTRKEEPGQPGESTEPTPDKEAAATVYIDVNPSVKLTLDAQKTVLDAEGINDDGKKLLENTALSGQPVERALGFVLIKTVDDNYLTKENNGVLLTVDSEDASLEKTLCAQLESAARVMLADSLPEVKIASQTLKTGAEIEELNRKHGVSPGKAKYILNILSADSNRTLEELVEKTTAELISICEKMSLPSGKNDIGFKKAYEIALSDAGLTAEQVNGGGAASSNGTQEILLYEINFDYLEASYSYKIDGDTGEILWKRVTTPRLDKEAAIAAALAYLKIDKGSADFVKAEYWAFEKPEYWVYVQKDGIEYLTFVIGAAKEIDAERSLQRPAELHLEQIGKIAYDELGLPYEGDYPDPADSIFSGGYQTPYPTLARVRVRIHSSGSCATMIIDRKTGEILYKEIARHRPDDVSKESAEAMAICAAKLDGGKEIETLSAAENGSSVVLRVDGKTFVYLLKNGFISSRRSDG